MMTVSEKVWDGKTINEGGVYSGITLRQYHEKLDLLDGPSVSKSGLKMILPFVDGGSPKRFWGHWSHNPDAVSTPTSDAMIFGSLVHCLLLNDEPFGENFLLRPAKIDGKPWQGNRTACKEWMAEAEATGKYVVTEAQIERVKRMADDAAHYPEVQMGALTGTVERSYFAKDPETGIWLRARPDVRSATDAMFVDLKSVSKMDEGFLTRQNADAGYYIQGALTRMVCRLLEIPFEDFWLVYTLNDDVPDTAHVSMSKEALDAGELDIRWALRTIKGCMDNGYWPGAEPFSRGDRPIGMTKFQSERREHFYSELTGDDAEVLAA